MADIEFQHVSKRYAAPKAVRGQAQESRAFWRRGQSRRESKAEFWALRDVSFQVEPGEALAIVGHNGAGKSTILKLLSNITAPTAGVVTIRRSLSALVEVSAGFHPELSGRENVYLTGVILGMSRREVNRKLPEIIEFSGIGEFLDVPVKRYSSGMSLRLGFAIAAHLEAEILLLDEVLAVGDVAFQWKCLERIEQLRQAGRTILLVSHDLSAVERLCDRAILLNRGQIACEGDPRTVIAEYQRSTLLVAEPPEHAAGVSRAIECTSFSYWSESRPGAGSVRTGDAMSVRVNYTARAALEGVVFHVYLYWPSGYLCTELSTSAEGATVAKGDGHLEFRCPFVNLRAGLYLVDVCVERPPEVLDWRHRCAMLRVNPGLPAPGDLHMPHESFLFERDAFCEPGEAGSEDHRTEEITALGSLSTPAS